MQSDLIEIRHHGRGGQGAKTLALLLAEAFFDSGRYVQAFPEYGPERTGAPVFSFNRVSSGPIFVHCAVTRVDVVTVLDSTLFAAVDVTSGLSENGIVIVNSDQKIEDVKKEYGLEKCAVCVVDASGISREIFEKSIVNTPMFGAVSRIVGLKFSLVEKAIRSRMSERLVEKNVKAARLGYDRVKTRDE